MTYQVVKRYGHQEGWSCTFRQWRATHSHCKYIHGYPLAFEIAFECETLDTRNWCLDFGGLKPLKSWLQSIFDHKLLVAEDDPEIQSFKAMRIQGIADIVILPDVGCEKFSELVYYEADRILQEMGEKPRVRVKSVRVSEHEGNSAIYTRD
jgi:6-pyruvoyltetrahydropterin/6-carboxytetrahydropterin synthase